MSKAILLQHVDSFGAGRLVPVLRDFGIPTEIRRLQRGDEIPTDLDEVRMIVVLGGPLHAAESASDAKFPFLNGEIELLKRLIHLDRPVLGIGFGAQLLAHAAGAKVYPNVKPGAKPEEPGTPSPEFGWAPVNFPFPGGTEPIVMGLMDGAPMFHWHTDTFDLPKLPAPANQAPPPAPPPPSGNSLLSSTRTCKNQAYRFKNRLFGFQYHFEQDEAGVEAILAGNKSEASTATGGDIADKVRSDTKLHFARYKRLGDRIIENFVQYLKVY